MEEKAILDGDYEEVFIEEFVCEICKKTFKSEAQLQQHFQSKKHKQAEAKLLSQVTVDDTTESAVSAAKAKRDAEMAAEMERIQKEDDERRQRELEELEESRKKKTRKNKEPEASEEEKEEQPAEDLEDWAWKKDKKGKNKEHQKLGAQKGHEKLIEKAQ